MRRRTSIETVLRKMELGFDDGPVLRGIELGLDDGLVLRGTRLELVLRQTDLLNGAPLLRGIDEKAEPVPLLKLEEIPVLKATE